MVWARERETWLMVWLRERETWLRGVSEGASWLRRTWRIQSSMSMFGRPCSSSSTCAMCKGMCEGEGEGEGEGGGDVFEGMCVRGLLGEGMCVRGCV